MEDIVPKLLEDIQSDFDRELKSSTKVKRITEKIKKGTETYKDADDYAVELGEILSKVFSRHLSSAVLPDGKMYYNIADRIVYGMLEHIYELIDDVSVQVQETLNEKAGIGIRAIKTPMNMDRAMGIVNKVSAAERFDDVAYMLGEPIVNFAQAVVMDNIKSNVDFHGQAGLKPTITRTVVGGCCDWCRSLAGTYAYPNVPKDVYRKHNFCRCLVVYDPGDGGSKENVHTKKVLTPEEKERLEERKRFRNFKYRDVTAEYFGKATPGKGKITYQEGLKESDSRDEISMAKLLHDKFGGDIKLLVDVNEDKIKTPDYIWRDKFWDLKTVTTEKSADSAIRKGLKQITENPGGIILDYRGNNISLEILEEKIDTRMRRGINNTTDIMVILKDNDIRVYRYKK